MLNNNVDKHLYIISFFYRAGLSKLAVVERLGFQKNGAFVLNDSLQLNAAGEGIPFNDYEVLLLPSHMQALNIPIPEVHQLDPTAAPRLFHFIEEHMPRAVYLTSLLLGGRIA